MRTHDLSQAGMNYRGATDEVIHARGKNPPCPDCGKPMVAADDHGRFVCFSCQSPRPRIPQVDTSKMSDADKAKVPPINRLYAPPTEAEERFFRALPGTTEYDQAREAVRKERGG